MNDRTKNLKDWEKFLDADEMKSNLIRASLYLFSYELLKNTIVDKIKDFYMTGFDENGFIYSKEYKEKVANRKVDGKQNIFLSSLHWLEEIGAITKNDISEISSIREMRNTVAHQIDKILTDSEFNIDSYKEEKMFDYIDKIERWWIREVEIPTNPNYDGEEIPDEGILPGKIIFCKYVKSITEDLLKRNESKTK